jgi:hypothetical protein
MKKAPKIEVRREKPEKGSLIEKLFYLVRGGISEKLL